MSIYFWDVSVLAEFEEYLIFRLVWYLLVDVKLIDFGCSIISLTDESAASANYPKLILMYVFHFCNLWPGNLRKRCTQSYSKVGMRVYWRETRVQSGNGRCSSNEFRWIEFRWIEFRWIDICIHERIINWLVIYGNILHFILFQYTAAHYAALMYLFFTNDN